MLSTAPTTHSGAIGTVPELQELTSYIGRHSDKSFFSAFLMRVPPVGRASVGARRCGSTSWNATLYRR
ncbi:MAG: hypothetical protein AB7R90_05345 [Reyranellaceae bacterium]